MSVELFTKRYVYIVDLGDHGTRLGKISSSSNVDSTRQAQQQYGLQIDRDFILAREKTNKNRDKMYDKWVKDQKRLEKRNSEGFKNLQQDTRGQRLKSSPSKHAPAEKHQRGPDSKQSAVATDTAGNRAGNASREAIQASSQGQDDRDDDEVLKAITKEQHQPPFSSGVPVRQSVEKLSSGESQRPAAHHLEDEISHPKTPTLQINPPLSPQPISCNATPSGAKRKRQDSEVLLQHPAALQAMIPQSAIPAPTPPRTPSVIGSKTMDDEDITDRTEEIQLRREEIALERRRLELERERSGSASGTPASMQAESQHVLRY